ncbi:polyketide synthase regulator [Paenibacillus bovis]|uniref:Polyketide synthase regulator n=1 Tax=Paenibacillus bovis TaxID=1616788 RepID=A0A172ZD40_9BACL|nr:polyketide synthase regulator [Paenibacillus bovis]
MEQVYQLLKLLLPSAIGLELEQTVTTDESELAARELGQWIVRQLSSRTPAEVIPDETVLRQRLNISMIPFLLVVDNLQNSNLQMKELEKLLSSYFDREVLLIPLHDNEWLILANHNLIEDDEQSDLSAYSGREVYSEHEDTEEDVLTAFALGLHELVASEWVGVFHISVARPLIPADRLLETVAQLRETIHLGKLFHVSDHIHLPWEMRLESLLYRIPVEERQRFVESAEDHSHLFGDEETVSTLETFFKMDCNVSETAKQLYIHRNTLLYRLDKIKQETQLDVRRFEDAVLMRLTLLLYKVTKS